MDYKEFLQERMKIKQDILNLRKSGMTYQEIGDLYGVSRQRIHQIINHEYRQKTDKQKAKNTARISSKQSRDLICHDPGVSVGKGIITEDFVSTLLSENGIENTLMDYHADYDILALGNVKIDVKSSLPHKYNGSASPFYTFQHRDKKVADIYICVTIDTKDIFVFPNYIMEDTKESMRFVWPSTSQARNKYHKAYHNRLDLIWQVHNSKLQAQEAANDNV